MRRLGGAPGAPLFGVTALAALCALAPAAQSAERLIEALESAPAAVVAEVLETRQLDTHGYRGRLRVESSLVGDVTRGATLYVGWEELAPSRPPRFAAGDRVLVALERLSGASIWLERIPAPDERTQTLGIRLRGNAFLLDPSPASVTQLSHYLSLSPQLRTGPTGVDALAQLAARGQPRLAAAAVERLDRVPSLDVALDRASANALVTALLRTDTRAEFVRALLTLVDTHDLEALRAPLAARLGDDNSPAPVILTALAVLDGGLPPERGRELLDPDAPVEHRRVAARWARGPDAPALLADAVLRDPDPGVRSRAVARLVELAGEDSVSQAAVGLYDPEPAVRATTASSLASLGSAAVPELRAAAESGVPTAAQAAVAGLQLSGSAEATAALVEIATSHPDPAIQKLARFALGGDIGHSH